ncbi:hypothetical protein [Fluctibacter halophilus]|nr:hypothetical protein [Aestuariibacter halophilus]
MSEWSGDYTVLAWMGSSQIWARAADSGSMGSSETPRFNSEETSH